jgi:hypothetical protein
MNDTTPVLLSETELWYLRSVIRHEAPDQEKWTSPPVSESLNDMIAAALNSGLPEVYLELTRRHLLAIDYMTDQSAKDSNGNLIGKSLLLSTFAARERLQYPTDLSEEPDNAEAYGRLLVYRRATEE